MSRKLRHNRFLSARRLEKPDETDNLASDDKSLKLPPRRKKFPSSIHKLNKWYYNILFILFVSLVVFLFWYGNKFSS